jgi:hypothetical protein
MKIALMTLWGYAGYGQNIQAYALQRFLRNAGHEAFVIQYPMSNFHGEDSRLQQCVKALLPPFVVSLIKGRRNLKGEVKKFFRFLQKDRMPLPVSPYYEFIRDGDYCYKAYNRGVPQFFEKHFLRSEKFYNSFAELEADPPDADVYMVGSDQVWGFYGKPLKISKAETVRAYFLDFGNPKAKRLSYAASFGTRGFDADSIQIMTPLMQKFDSVSVREEAGLGVCKSCGVTAEWVPDPTLLLRAEEYRALYEDAQYKAEKPYCLVYMLRDNFDFLEKVYRWAAKQNTEVKLILNNGLVQHAYKEINPTVVEWVSLFDNAKWVITDSYHGSVFSLIFGKRFGIIPFAGRNGDLRLNDLFKRFRLKPRYLESDDFSVLSTGVDEAASAGLREIYQTYNADWLANNLEIQKFKLQG